MDRAEATELLRRALVELEELKKGYRDFNPQELLSLSYAMVILHHDVIKGGIR